MQLYGPGAGRYYFADSVRFNTNTNLYELYNQDGSDVVTYDYSESYADLVGMYTCGNNYTSCFNAHYVTSTSKTTYYYFLLDEGKLLEDVDFPIYYGNDFSGNTLIDYNYFMASEWVEKRDSLIGKYVCSNPSYICEDLMLVTSTYSDSTRGYDKSRDGYYKYGTSYTYSNGQYKLTGDIIQSLNYGDKSVVDFDSIHFSCLSESDTCSTLYYIQFSKKTSGGITKFAYRYYIALTGGESIQDAINNMLYANDVNSVNSTMKNLVDGWYRSSYLSDPKYSEYIDDVIYCNDRSNTDDISLIGNSSRFNIHFDNSNTEVDFSCKNVTDRFSVSNNSAKLDYPIALPTSEEMAAWGSNSLRAMGFWYYTMSPRTYSSYAINHVVGSEGAFNVTGDIESPAEVRPVIAIKSGYPIIQGSGNRENPYIISEYDLNT